MAIAKHEGVKVVEKRTILSHPDWLDPDGLKIYTIATHQQPVDRSVYEGRLTNVKRAKGGHWSNRPGFVIYHDGEHYPYLVLAWWGNSNELFTSISVKTESGWVEDPTRFSFCLWDMEVMWQERRFFIDYLYREEPDLETYRACRAGEKASGAGSCE